MSFFDPNLIYDDGTTFKAKKYEEILQEQVLISYMSQSISIFDTDMLCPYDRKIIFKTLHEIKEAERESIKETFKPKK